MIICRRVGTRLLPFRKILVPVACSHEDADLLAYATMLGRMNSAAEFAVVHVQPPETARPDGRCALTELRADLGQARVSCTILRGDRLDAVLRFAAVERTDLILLGHRRARSGRRSLAKRLAMSAPCSVWLVPEGAPAKVERVLAGIDFSSRSADALAIATHIAEAAGHEQCYGLHVRFSAAVAASDEYADIDMANVEDAFHLFVSRVDLHGVDVKPVIEESPNIANTIRRVATERQCDLIVMGTRGRSAAASVLLGSETEQTMVQTDIPLLAVKHHGAKLRLLQAMLDQRFRRRVDLHFS